MENSIEYIVLDDSIEYIIIEDSPVQSLITDQVAISHADLALQELIDQNPQEIFVFVILCILFEKNFV